MKPARFRRRHGSRVASPAEDSHSGLVRTIGNRVGDETPRGFKSRILRHPMSQDIPYSPDQRSGLFCRAGGRDIRCRSGDVTGLRSSAASGLSTPGRGYMCALAPTSRTCLRFPAMHVLSGAASPEPRVAPSSIAPGCGAAEPGPGCGAAERAPGDGAPMLQSSAIAGLSTPGRGCRPQGGDIYAPWPELAGHTRAFLPSLASAGAGSRERLSCSGLRGLSSTADSEARRPAASRQPPAQLSDGGRCRRCCG